jgi:hypothetical protein
MPLALLLVAGMLSGCGNSTQSVDPTTSSQDRAEITTEMAQQSEVMEDGVSDDPGEINVAEDASFGVGAEAAIRPLTFWREFRFRDRRFEFAFSDSDSTGRPTRALVTVSTRLRGRLHILAGPPPTAGEAIRDSLSQIIKPFDEMRVRRVLLVRVRTENDARVRWRVAACSPVEVSSSGNTVNIASIRLQSGDVDVTFSDPQALVRFRNVLRLDPNAEAHLTVTTGNSDDIVVLHHAGLRVRLVNNGDNTYSGNLPVGLFLRRLRHFGIDVMSRGTLFDDASPYDSERWVLPFLIAPEVLEDPEPAA